MRKSGHVFAHTFDCDTDHFASSNVFLGLSLDRQDENDASETAYKAAVNLKNRDVLAWQGLVSLYEKQAGKKLDDYHDAAIRLAEVHMNEYVGQPFMALAGNRGG